MARHGTARKFTARQWRWRRLARRGSVWLIAAAVLAALGVADRAGLFGRTQEPDIPRYHGKTFRAAWAVDGDTIDLDVPDGPHRHTRVRLWGVDTPESVRPEHPVEYFGREASHFTDRAVRGQNVRLELLPHNTRDKYGRLLAYVFLPDGRLLNGVLIEQGYGYADPRFEHPRKREFSLLQAEARRERRGLWKDPHPKQWPGYLGR